MFQEEFVSISGASRVRFGAGVRRALGEEMDAFGLRRALILTTPQQADTAQEFADLLGARAAGVLTGAVMHTPVSVSEEATKAARRLQADCTVAIGGGSTTGLGKAIALRTDLLQIVVPTTYAGSEATPILGQTEGGRKTTMTTPKVQPEVILYDAELVRTLPMTMTVTSALNAMAHAAEGLHARNRSPISTLSAIEGLRAFREALPRVVAEPDELRGPGRDAPWRLALRHRAWPSRHGVAPQALPHTRRIVRPATCGNARHHPAARGRLQREGRAAVARPIADILGGATAGRSLHDFAVAMKAPRALRDLGLREADLDRAADIASENAYRNPCPVEREALRRPLQAAWAGEPPAL